VLVPDADTGKIECYGIKDDKQQITEFTYIPNTPATSMPEVLIDAVVWYTAYRCLSILRTNPNEAATAEKEALKSLQLRVNG
jgi:hypothetical protein